MFIIIELSLKDLKIFVKLVVLDDLGSLEFLRFSDKVNSRPTFVVKEASVRGKIKSIVRYKMYFSYEKKSRSIGGLQLEQ